MSIESNPLLDVHSINTDSAYLLFGDSSDETFSMDASNLLGYSDIQLSPKYFVKSILLDDNLRRAGLDPTVFLNHSNLLADKSRFYCKVDFIVDVGASTVSQGDGESFDNRTFSLPSLLIYKEYESKNVYVRGFKESYSLSNQSSAEIVMSRLHNSNHDYNLNCLLSTQKDSISFSYISYARNKIFDTRMNFTFVSFSMPPAAQVSGSVFQAPIWDNAEENIDVLDNSLSVARLSGVYDGGDVVTYSLSGTDASSFNLNQNTGTIGFKQRPLFDQKNLYTVDLTATNSIGSDTISLSINIVDVDYTVVILDGTQDAPAYGLEEEDLYTNPDDPDPTEDTLFNQFSVEEELDIDQFNQDRYVEPIGGNVTLQTNSGNFSSGATFEPGELINLIPNPDAGFEFVEWRVDEINLDITDNSFIMPRSHVSIRPVFRAV